MAVTVQVTPERNGAENGERWMTGPDDPRYNDEPQDGVDPEDEGWDEDTEDPGDDVGTI